MKLTNHMDTNILCQAEWEWRPGEAKVTAECMAGITADITVEFAAKCLRSRMLAVRPDKPQFRLGPTRNPTDNEEPFMNHRTLRHALVLAAAALVLPLATPPAVAQAASAATSSSYFVRDKTSDGFAFVSGGISVDDRRTMHAEQKKYTLWVATVAKPSGAYLADAKLKILDTKDKRTVVERTMEGPWYMVALPAGRYQVQATFRADGASTDQTLSETVNVSKGSVRQAVLRFDSKATVSPEMQSPFDGNPFGAPVKGR